MHRLSRRPAIFTCLAAVLAALVVSVAPAAPADDDLASMLADLLQRVQKLEAEIVTLKKQLAAAQSGNQAGAAPATAPAAASAPAAPAPGSRVMQVLRIEPVPVDPTLQTQIDQLRSDAEQIDDQARQADAQRLSLEDQRSNRSRDYGGSGSSGDGVTGQIAALRKQVSQLRGQAHRKRSDADKLEQQVESARQRIGGWDGERIVLLTTTRDLGSVLSGLDRGAFLTWKGDRVRLTAQTDEYTTDSVAVVEAPDGFTPPPANLKLPPALQDALAAPATK